MKKLYTILLSMLMTCSTQAQEQFVLEDMTEPTWPLNVQIELDSIIANDPLLETSQLGLMVIDLTADSTIYAYNHRQTMRPASTMKLVTAITALDRLGSDYQLSTSLYYTGTIKDRTLNGTLFCVGGMDPTFDTSDMHNFACEVKNLDIDTLRGSIATDCSMKESAEWGEGWCWDDDNPTLSPLLANKRPNFAEQLIEELNRVGVVTDSLTLFDERPTLDAKLLVQAKHSIDRVLLRMMKESDNLYAECLYYQLAASFGHRPARAVNAKGLEKHLVNSIGLNSDDYRFADGSGLSLYNYVSPELLARLLYFAWKTPHIYRHLLPSLPIAGEDGTLKKRMKNTSAEGNVKAKTGTVSGISSLAGYLTAPNGHQLCFAIINQGVMRGKDARTFQDKVCVTLCGDKLN